MYVSIAIHYDKDTRVNGTVCTSTL